MSFAFKGQEKVELWSGFGLKVVLVYYDGEQGLETCGVVSLAIELAAYALKAWQGKIDQPPALHGMRTVHFPVNQGRDCSGKFFVTSLF